MKDYEYDEVLRAMLQSPRYHHLYLFDGCFVTPVANSQDEWILEGDNDEDWLAQSMRVRHRYMRQL